MARPRGCGGIGRRAGFRFQWLKDREGSTPSIPIMEIKMNDVRVQWTTLRGDEYRGVVREVDDNVLIVDCDDGERRAVELDSASLED